MCCWQCIGEAQMLRGFVMSTLNKVPQVRLDIVQTDEYWENWDMESLINNLQQWLKRHKVDDAPGDSGGVRPKREKHWYDKEKRDPVCIFCEGKHWGDTCEVINTIEARRQFFQEKKLCFKFLWPRRTLGEAMSKPSMFQVQVKASYKSLWEE